MHGHLAPLEVTSGHQMATLQPAAGIVGRQSAARDVSIRREVTTRHITMQFSHGELIGRTVGNAALRVEMHIKCLIAQQCIGQ